MRENADFVWNNGERNRQLDVYRPCPCGTCSSICKGIGYLSFSDTDGRGFTIWLENEEVFQRLSRALRHFRKDQAGKGVEGAVKVGPTRIQRSQSIASVRPKGKPRA